MSEGKIEPLIDTLNLKTGDGFAVYYEGRMDVGRLDRLLSMLVVIRNNFADCERAEIQAAVHTTIDSRVLNGEPPAKL